MKKNILFILIFILICQCSYSQEIVEGEYYPQPNLEKVEGIWIGKTQSDSLVIKLFSQKTFLKGPNIYMDQLKGYHNYYRNGKLIESSFNSGDYTLTSGNIDEENSNIIIRFFFEDLTKGKRGIVILNLSSINATEAEWILRNREGIRVDEFDASFTLPRNMILHKINEL